MNQEQVELEHRNRFARFLRRLALAGGAYALLGACWFARADLGYRWAPVFVGSIWLSIILTALASSALLANRSRSGSSVVRGLIGLAGGAITAVLLVAATGMVYVLSGGPIH